MLARSVWILVLFATCICTPRECLGQRKDSDGEKLFKSLKEPELAAINALPEHEKSLATYLAKNQFEFPKIDLVTNDQDLSSFGSRDDDFKTGNIGSLSVSYYAKIEQSRNDSPDDLRLKLATSGSGRFTALPISQVIDEDSALILGSEIWIDGVSTQGVTDGARLELQGTVFAVAGTKSYSAASGAKRTVHHLVAINKDQVMSTLNPIIDRLGFRTWHNSDRSLVFVGKVRSKSGKNVTFKLVNGKSLKLDLKELSESDREFLTKK